MKRWAVLTVLLYAFALLLLTVPIIYITGGWSAHDVKLPAALEIFKLWGYWLWLAILVAGQALLLLLPINLERRLPARRPLKIPVIVTAFFLGNLLLAGLVSILCAVFKEDGLLPFAYLSPSLSNPLNPNGLEFTTGTIITFVTFWLVWAIIFRNFAKVGEPTSLLKRITRWLLTGSILELLIAVPSHVIVRRRDDCCAPAGTFWGIATGISIMLLCFGPGVFFLFVERFQRLKPKETNPITDRKN
ncbi:MAG: hypothetical protein WDM76_18690 [Limisphaerales bacterium]